MRFFVGIDDTDNLESRGTGHHARQLGDLLSQSGFGLLGVTRHQLFVDARIPYTSHNSSACLQVAGKADRRDDLIALCRQFLRDESASGSDAGLCVLDTGLEARLRDEWDADTAAVVDFGMRAKQTVVTVDEAAHLAAAARAHLEPLTGTGLGVIGALAAVGLRTGGNDGRFLWLPGLRDTTGVHTVSELRARVHVDAFETEGGRAAADRDRIALGPWARPLLRGGRSVLLIEESGSEEYDWIVAAKERIKQLSE